MKSKMNPVIQINPWDNVAIAKADLKIGTQIDLGGCSNNSFKLISKVPKGHKVSVKDINEGEPIIRYGEVIGVASKHIFAGELVHLHNIKSVKYEFDYALTESAAITDSTSFQDPGLFVDHKGKMRKFKGYQRLDGRVGTRNFVVVMATTQCATQVCQKISNYFDPVLMKEYPNVDGVIALTHNGGCGQGDYELLQRTLSGMINHPNVADAVLVGLGCEGNQLQDILGELMEKNLTILNQPSRVEIQAIGGSHRAIQEGIELVKSILPKANRVQRSSQPISKLVVALECGGSDSWSGITANPLVGRVSDTIIKEGGTVVLSETPEIFGAEHLLLNRCINSEVREQLINKLTWWQDYVIRIGASLEDNPSPGNKAGGLTNICEKSLGAITKSGSSPLMAVYDYAERIRAPGFVFMDSPGNDPVSITGMVAGGCNLVLFTTGRGSVFGFKPAPSIKICTNTDTYLHMNDDMDFNAGRLLEDGETLENLKEELFELMIRIASGNKSRSEDLGLGEMEFVPWFREGFL